MNLKEYLKQPIAVIAENNISNDILNEKSNFQDILKIAGNYREKFSDFYAVFVDSEYKPKAVLKSENLPVVIELLKKVDESEYENTLLKNFEIPSLFPINPKHVLRKDDVIEKAIKIFVSKDCNTNVITVVDDAGSYSGKVRRSTLVKKINNITT